jgi:hypothetical protein
VRTFCTSGVASAPPGSRPQEHSFGTGFNSKGYGLNLRQAVLNFQAWLEAITGQQHLELAALSERFPIVSVEPGNMAEGVRWRRATISQSRSPSSTWPRVKTTPKPPKQRCIPRWISA